MIDNGWSAWPSRPDEGACWNCAFLCRRDFANAHLATYYELTQDDRQRARFFTLGSWNLPPTCFRAMHITDEIEQTSAVLSPIRPNLSGDERNSVNHAAVTVLAADRGCDKWMRYHPGLDPRASFDLGLQLVDQQQRRDALRLAGTQLQLTEAQSQLTTALESLQRQHLAFIQRESGMNRWMQQAFLILAVLTLVLALLPLAYPNGIEWIVERAPGAARPVAESATPTQTVSPTH
ncbi:MAG: hypothetical protein WC211_02375 [Dehalococcoidia bacterium]